MNRIDKSGTMNFEDIRENKRNLLLVIFIFFIAGFAEFDADFVFAFAFFVRS